MTLMSAEPSTLLDVCFDNGEKESMEKIYPQEMISTLSTSDAFDRLTSNSHFFSENRFQLCLTPYAIHTSNFPECISATNTRVCSSRRTPDGALDGISFSTVFRSPGGVTLIAEYYGNDVGCAIGHLIHHINHVIVQKLELKLYIVFAVPISVDYESVMKPIRSSKFTIEKQYNDWLLCHPM